MNLANDIFVLTTADEYKNTFLKNFLFRFIKLFDNPINLDVSEDEKDPEQTEHDKEFMQTYIETLKDRGNLQLMRRNHET